MLRVDRLAERRVLIRVGAPADEGTALEQCHPGAVLGQSDRGGKPRSTCADDDYVLCCTA